MNAPDWFPTIPDTWELRRADASLTYVKSAISTEEISSEEVCHYSIPAVQETGDAVIQNGSEIESNKIRLVGGELLVSKLNPQKGCVVLTRVRDELIVCSTEFVPLIAKAGFDIRFGFYVYSSAPVRELIASRVQSATRSHQRANPADIAKIRIPVPPLPVQRSIVGFLDRETARLDALIAAKERMLRLLEEKRRALITRAVTRGINADVQMRDSGVPWVGKVPDHWEIWKIGHFATVGNGSTPSRDNAAFWADGDIPWLTSSVVNSDLVTEAEEFVTAAAFRECHLPLVPPDSVLVGITGQGKTRGQAAVLSLSATINQHLAFISPAAGIVDAWYLRWVLFAAYEFLRSISDDAGGTKGALTCEEISSLHLPVPPLDEQKEIVKYINASSKNLDDLSSATDRTIRLLSERRSALIAAAVTGQLAIPEPTEQSPEEEMACSSTT